MRRVIVTASDDNYLPFAKGLWLSLRDSAHDLAFVDFGNAERTKEWLAAEMPRVDVFPLPQEVVEWSDRLAFQQYYRALLLRPHLPGILQADAVAWVDTDAWVQDVSTFDLVFRAVDEHPEGVVVAPVMDLSYKALIEWPQKFMEDNIGVVYDTFYGPKVAQELQWRPLLACCLFAMAGSNPMWSEWGAEIERLYVTVTDAPPNVRHTADQIAFNYLTYTHGRQVLIDARHSYLASLGPLRRDEGGTVVIDDAERRPVGIVQLTGMTFGCAEDFLRRGLLWDRGEYLSAAEREHLLSLHRS